MKASKAHAGGLGAALSLLILYLLRGIPWVQNLPDRESAALEFVIATAVGWVIVYSAPANTREVWSEKHRKYRTEKLRIEQARRNSQ